MRKNKSLKFTTSRDDKKARAKKGLVLVLAFLAVFVSICAVIFIATDEFEPAESTSSTSGSTQPDDPELLSGDGIFMLFAQDSTSKNLIFLQLARVDLDAQQIFIYPVSPQEKLHQAGSDITAQECLKTSGAPELESAIEEKFGITINKYFGSKSTGFSNAITYMGGVTFNIAERIEYRTDDVTLLLNPGSQILRGTTLLKYIRYAATKDDGLLMQAQITAKTIDRCLTEENMNKSDSLFLSIMDKTNDMSDISALDFKSASDKINAFILSDKRKASTATDNWQVFLGNTGEGDD